MKRTTITVKRFTDKRTNKEIKTKGRKKKVKISYFIISGEPPFVKKLEKMKK